MSNQSADVGRPESARSPDLPTNLALYDFDPHPCSYLPGQTAAMRGLLALRMSGSAYQQLMDAGFRRSGSLFYQPACPDCQQCIPLRVPVARFAFSKSQRRTVRANVDVDVEVDDPAISDEKLDLYAHYLAARHDGQQSPDFDSLAQFLYRSPTDTVEFTYRLAGRLVGVGICDLTPQAVSTVYFYFDPDESKRRLGVFSALLEIDYARQTERPYYYLGYWVSACRAMAYKSDYRPCEILGADGVWRELQP